LEVHDLATELEGRVANPLLLTPADRQGDGIGVVEGQVLGRGDERRVRADPGGEEGPGLRVGGGLFLEPADGLLGDAEVVADILGVAGAGVQDRKSTRLNSSHAKTPY